jgi:integrase
MAEFRAVQYRGKWAVEWYEEGKRHRASLRLDTGANRPDVLQAFAGWQAQYESSHRPSCITVAYAWAGYRESLGDKPAAVTMGHEWKAVGPFFGDKAADALTEGDCQSYAALRRAKGRSDGTIWTELGHLRSALKWAERKNLILKAPAIARPERPPPRDKRLTRAEAKRFLEACELPHVRLFVTLAITTGARMGALLDLTWDRIDLDRGLIHLQDPAQRRTNKGRALVPMNQTARQALTEARQGATTKHVIEWGGHKVATVKKALKGAGARCGLPWVTAHVFRHSSACMMAENGVPMAEIAQFLGHADSRLTERVYARFSPAYLSGAASSLEL